MARGACLCWGFISYKTRHPDAPYGVSIDRNDEFFEVF